MEDTGIGDVVDLGVVKVEMLGIEPNEA